MKRRLFGLGLLAALGACGDPGGGAGGAGGSGDGCESAGCPAGESCVQGTCQPTRRQDADVTPVGDATRPPRPDARPPTPIEDATLLPDLRAPVEDPDGAPPPPDAAPPPPDVPSVVPVMDATPPPVVDAAPPPVLDAAVAPPDGPVDVAIPPGDVSDAAIDAAADADVAVDPLPPDGDVGLACEPRPERCDGLDNDCDGDIDEDFRTLGDPCTVGRGVCEASGTVVCFGGAAVCNVDPGPSGPELCNQLDDDCDGLVDEDFPELGLPCQVGDGICFNVGDNVCNPAGEMVCTAEPLPGEVESCNGLDDDCDGLVDNGFGLGEACTLGLGECADDGEMTCDGNGGATCRAFPGVPVNEICNGLDDDCDGEPDNGFEGLGLPCRAGLGICEAVGAVICNDAGDGFTCDAVLGEPRVETCNGLDDDCSGGVDDFEPQLVDNCGQCGVVCALTNAVPACRDSVCAVAGCQPGFVDLDGDPDNGCETSCRPTNPPVEVCDAIDNDCDGAVDGPEVCVDDAFFFCQSRQGVAPPWFCHDFAPGSLDADWWEFSIGRVGAVPGVITGDGNYGGGVSVEPGAGGGRTARTKIFGPAFRLGYHAQYRGSTVGAGVFNNTARPNNDPASTGTGFTFEVYVADGGQPGLRVIEHPGLVVRASAGAPALVDGLSHYVSATRATDGRWRLTVDGLPLPLVVDAPDATQTEFNRVTVFSDAVAEDGEGSRLDNLVIEVDADDDGRYPPADDCPDVPNAETLDEDGNGRGVACDDRDADEIEDALDPCPAIAGTAGDADEDGVDDACDGDGQALLVSMGPTTPKSPYRMRLEDGVRWRPFVGVGVMDHFAAAPDGRLAYTGDRSIGLAAADGSGAAPLLLNAERPQWLADGRLLYVGADGGYFTVDDDGQNPALLLSANPGEQLRVRAVRGGSVLVVIRAVGPNAAVELLDLALTPLRPAALAPGTGDAPPFVDLHPTEMRLLVSGAAGAATGVGLVDLDRLLLRRLSNVPTTAAVFSPNGRTVVALQETPAGRRLVAFAPTPGAAVAELAPANPDFGDTLSWAPAEGMPAAVDADRDGLHDATDACPTHPWEGVPAYREFNACHGVESPWGDMRLTWDGADWWLGIIGMCDTRNIDAVQLDVRGGYRGSVYLGRQHENHSVRRAPNVVWNGRGHTIALATISPVGAQRLQVMDDNRVLGPASSLYANGEDSYAGSIALIRRGDRMIASGADLRTLLVDRTLTVHNSAARLAGLNKFFVEGAPRGGGGLLIGATGSPAGIHAIPIDDALGAGAPSQITPTDTHRFNVAQTPGGYVVVWTDAANVVYARPLNAAGAPTAAAVRVSLGFEPADRAEITVVEGKVLIAWPQQTAGNDRVYVRAYTPAVVPLGGAFPVGPSLQEIQAVGIAADDAGRVAVTWMEQRVGQNPRNRNHISIGRFQCREP